jgi:hypothetical protein
MSDGRIMKCDWECPETADVDEELLEEYIAKLMKEQGVTDNE